MAAEIGDVLARLRRMRLRFVRLAAQPAHDRDAVVTEDHEAVVQIAHQPRELELQDPVERAQNCFVFFGIER